MSPNLQSYSDRAGNFTNVAARNLLSTMERKRSNLAVSVDVTTAKEFIAIVDAVGPFVCLIKTHIDVIEDFDFSLIERLTELSVKHDFMIFEDRKFADIGNTVALQYSGGVYKIASWSHITNAHPVPGPSIVSGLSSVGLPLGRGLLLLAEMSTEGSLAVGEYTASAVRMANDHRDFVIGFIAQGRMKPTTSDASSDEDFLVLTPGVGLDVKGDGMGQQYRTPHEVIFESGCDVIIVGRGIYRKGLGSIEGEAEQYRNAGWTAYLQRVSGNAQS